MLLLCCACGALPAADLGQEAVRWGPVPPRAEPYPAEVPPWWMSWYGLWCADALVWGEQRERAAGLERVERTTAPIDGQVSIAFLHARPWRLYNHREEDPDQLYLRPYLRVGTDAQAPRGSDFESAGAALGWGFLGSVAGEIGHSGERHLVMSGDADLFLLHLRGELDDQRRTGRIGFSVRIPGGIDGWAFGMATDFAVTTLRTTPPTGRRCVHGGIGEATAQWLVEKNVHIDAQISGATRTITAAGAIAAGEVSAAAGIGVGW